VSGEGCAARQIFFPHPNNLEIVLYFEAKTSPPLIASKINNNIPLRLRTADQQIAIAR